MSPGQLVTLMVIMGVILGRGVRIPLTGWRKRVVVGCRLVVALALWALLGGFGARHVEHLPRRLVYLVDGSTSVDAAQAEWMARRIASLESMRPQQIERAVLAFGGDAEVVVPFGRQPLTDAAAIRHALGASRIRRDQTNLEAALLAALGILPSTPGANVVLLSDGWETAGNLAGILTHVRRLGLEVFPAPTPRSGTVQATWEALVVPPVVRRGSPIPIELVVVSGSAQAARGQVTVALRGIPLKRQPVAVRPGWQVIRVAAPAVNLGTMSLEVRLEIPSQGLSERRAAYTEVEGPPQVLVVSDRVSSLPPLAAALKRRDMDVAIARLDDLPETVSGLIDYDAVVMLNPAKSRIAASSAQALTTYVEGFGGGLLTVGLGGELAQEIQQPSPIDPLLPIQFEPRGLKEAKRRVCLILLIDRSASMVGPRIAATKQAAVALVKHLQPEDLVGVLAFDTAPYVVAEVQPAGQADARLVEKLVKLRSSGGTDIYPALVSASERLELTGATLKHIILLSDGNTPVQEAVYHRLAKSLREANTTVSTITTGTAFVNTEFMEWLARATGGEAYQLRKVDELPTLVVRDTQQALGRLPFTEGYFRPRRAPAAEWFADATEWPPLKGYLTANARPGAMVELVVPAGAAEPDSASLEAASQGTARPDDPLLVRWGVGRGRVASFVSDAETRWSPEWVRWPGFDGAWAEVIRWVLRPRLTEELFVWVDDSHGIPQLVFEGVLQDPRATLFPPEGSVTTPLSLVHSGPWRWEASLEHVPSGWYQLAVESVPPSSEASEGTRNVPTDLPPPTPDMHPLAFAKRWVQIGTPPSSREMTGQPPRESVLRQMARSTGGAYDAPDRALLPQTTTTTSTVPRVAWWLPLALLLLLVEIALRGPTML